MQISEANMEDEPGMIQSAHSTVSKRSHASLVSKRSKISEVTRSIQLEENPFVDK